MKTQRIIILICVLLNNILLICAAHPMRKPSTEKPSLSLRSLSAPLQHGICTSSRELHNRTTSCTLCFDPLNPTNPSAIPPCIRSVQHTLPSGKTTTKTVSKQHPVCAACMKNYISSGSRDCPTCKRPFTSQDLHFIDKTIKPTSKDLYRLGAHNKELLKEIGTLQDQEDEYQTRWALLEAREQRVQQQEDAQLEQEIHEMYLHPDRERKCIWLAQRPYLACSLVNSLVCASIGAGVQGVDEGLEGMPKGALQGALLSLVPFLANTLYVKGEKIIKYIDEYIWICWGIINF